jgi:hypothetical protein
MGTVLPPPGSLGPEGKKTGTGWPAIVLVAVLAALILTAARGYLKSQEKPPAPVFQPTAVVVQIQPTADPTLIPTINLEKDLLRIAEEILKKRLKSPSTYKRISSLEVWGEGGHRFRIEFDAQNAYGALMRECYYVPLQEQGNDPAAPDVTPCNVGDSLGWRRP